MSSGEDRYSKNNYYSLIDSVLVESDTIQTRVYWEIEPYSVQIYNYIRYYGDGSIYTLDNVDPNLFLNSIVKSNYEDFRDKLLNDNNFQDKLKDEISKYDYFKGVFSSDSLLKFIAEENVKRKKVYGYICELTFKINSNLEKRRIIFDPKMEKILNSKVVGN